MKSKKIMLILFSPFFLVIDYLIKPILFCFFYRNNSEKKIMWLTVLGRIKIKNLSFDLTKEDELVVAYFLQLSSRYWCNEKEKQEIIAAAINFINAKKYNRILFLLFISNNFKHADELTQYALTTLIENENINSFPYYLAASYYFNQNNLKKSNAMLIAANNLQKFDFFESELRVIINKVVFLEAKDPILPGLIWQYDIWHLSLVVCIAEFIDNNQEEVNVAIVRTFGAKLLNNTTAIVGKKIAIGFMSKGVDKESLEYKIINEEHKSLLRTKSSADIKDFNNFNEYLLDLIKVGEFQSLKNLSLKEKKSLTLQN
jgi:hypothetical protein